ncbi:MAG: TonB family protein [Taibaiella sp.]|jgi:protein TonB
METNKILQSDYLDLIFDNRNKNYGGYELRKHYNRRALKALGITFSVILLGVGTPFILSQLNAKAPVVASNNAPDVIKITEVLLPPPPEPPHAPKPPEPVKAGTPPAAKTIQNTVPDIVPDNLVKPDVKPPDIKDFKDAVSGPVTNPGENGIVAATSTKPHTGPNGIPAKNGNGSDIANEEPRTFTEIMPEFPGGMAALLAFVQKNLRYPNEAREDGIEGRVIVRFVVNTLGEIEGAKIMRGIGGGCDKEALRVVNAMPKWKPGKQNGHNVKVYYTLPITFKLQ